MNPGLWGGGPNAVMQSSGAEIEAQGGNAIHVPILSGPPIGGGAFG